MEYLSFLKSLTGRDCRWLYYVWLSLFAVLTPYSAHAIEPPYSQPINVILPPWPAQSDVLLDVPLVEPKSIGEDEQPELSLPNLSDSSAIVVIDPGHGGPDPGAVGNGLLETEIVLDISFQVADLLQQQGIQALLTRDAEYDLGLKPRAEFANQQ